MIVKSYYYICFIMVEHIKHNCRVTGSESDRNVRVSVMKIYIMRIYHFFTYRVRSNDVNMTAAFIVFCDTFFEGVCQSTNLMRAVNKLMTFFGKCYCMIYSFK